jgi:hypothetical protein
MSCCVSGFRIIQLEDGECCAEFLAVFSYGSRTFSAWKTLHEFSELAHVVQHYNSLYNDLLSQTIKHWNVINKYIKWNRCLRVSYLMEMSIGLGAFIQSLFTESPTPALLIRFMESPNFMIS